MADELENEKYRLRGRRLLLRPPRVEDAARIRELAGDWAIADTTGSIPHPFPRGAAERWIADSREKVASGDLANFVITLGDSGELVGVIGLVISKKHSRASLGYWIGRPYWNRGYATEAGQLVLAYAFNQIGLNRVEATHMTRNPASGRVMQKLGMNLEGILRKHISRWEQFEDMALYAILSDEYLQARR